MTKVVKTEIEQTIKIQMRMINLMTSNQPYLTKMIKCKTLPYLTKMITCKTFPHLVVLSVASIYHLIQTTDSELLVPFSDRKEDRVELDMGNGIKLWTTLHYSSNLRRFTTIKWNMSDRNENQFKNLFNNEKKFSSDIFKIISRKKREGQESKTLFNFPFSQAMSNSSMFRVPVDGKNMSANFTTDAKFVVAFSVGVGKDSNWKEAEAKLEVFIRHH